MNGIRSSGKSHLDNEIRLVIVESPDVAAPLVNALDVADIGAWMWVEAESALFVSPRVLVLLGLTAEPRADLPQRLWRGVHADDRSPIRELMDKRSPAGPFALRYRFTPPGGPLRWIEDRGRVERTAAGDLIRQGGALREVTREVGQEQERREADARLEALINALPFSVWGRSGPKLTVTHQNADSIACWGDIRGRALDEAPPDVHDLWRRQLAEVMTGQVVRNVIEQERDGELRIFSQIIAPVVVEQHVTGAVGVSIDVTEEERARKFDLLLTDITSAFASRSAATLDTALSMALERIGRFFGASLASLSEITAEQQLRVTHWWLGPDSGRDRPFVTEMNARPLSALVALLAKNLPVIVRSHSDLPEGEARAWLEARRLQSFVVMPARQSDGTLCMLGLAALADQIIDWPPDTIPLLRVASTVLGSVLERVRAEANQKAVERRIYEAHKLESLGVLAGGIAHDFNNLLTAILGNASLLRAEYGELPAMSGALDQIETASRRAADLCRQMLAYAGRGRFALRALDLSDFVRDSHPLLRLTVPKIAALELFMASDLPPVLADETQLRQLLLNLMINAVEALGERAGTIQLKTSHGPKSVEELAGAVFSPQLPGGEYVSLRVSDSGEGMTPETLPRIFDPFFTTKFTGRGLGLAAVVGIVRAHKGALLVVSRRGEGSTFEVLLPAQVGPAARPPEAALPATHAAATMWRTQGSVLVVDDELGVRHLVRTVLERTGLTVVLAEDGRQAVELFRQAPSDVRLVLMDLTMPGLDGGEALAEMRKVRPDIPAILMSGYTPANIVSAASYTFLQKPFTPAVLQTAVRQALGE
ncbi:MAG: response regulator [Acidobacteria bacterium]|nr:response regulator [Acidobacteriota bacterium]